MSSLMVRCGRALAAALALSLQAGGAAASVSVEADQPRAFGYSVGDRVERRVTVRASAGLTLDETSLPAVGRKGRALELRELERQVFREAGGGQRLELRFVYQVFLAPPATRTLEMPPVTLNFRPDAVEPTLAPSAPSAASAAASAATRSETARIDAWPLTVSPLVPVDVSPRRGLGEWQADAPPPLIDTLPAQRRLLACAVLLALLLGYLLAVYIVLPWFGRQGRPFERAWRALRSRPAPSSADQQRAALRDVHTALNEAAGQVLFAGGVDAFIARQPRYAPLRAELLAFFGHSQQAFFAQPNDRGKGEAEGAAVGPWLLAFCRRCRDLERGTA